MGGKRRKSLVADYNSIRTAQELFNEKQTSDEN